MKVNWFSPLLPLRTDIAHYTARVLPFLRERAEIRLWTEEENWLAPYHLEAARFSPDAPDWRSIQAADVSVYQIGNNSSFHSGIWELSRRHPGIVVLHDECLQHLFAGYYLEKRKQPDVYFEHMRRWYGHQGLEAAAAYLSGKHSTDEMARAYPLTELAIENACGVVVHTVGTYNQLKSKIPCPLAYLDLPYRAAPPETFERWQLVRRAACQKKRYRAVLFGYLGPNRRLNSILQAFAEFPGRSRFELFVYGVSDTAFGQVKNDVTEYGLADTVHLHGYVEDLDGALAQSDLAFNLRYPTMGESSGTQLRIWDHALPSIVTRTGWYATLPGDSVAFVRPENEVDDIRHHLQSFLDDPPAFAQIGERGRNVLVTRHSPTNYARDLIWFAGNALGYLPCTAGLDLIDRTAGLIVDCIPPNAQAIARDRLVNEVSRLFYNTRRNESCSPST